MYIPSHFAQPDRVQLHAAIERYSFATLISGPDGHLFANHLPLMLDRQEGPHGTLIGHMARANPQWHSAAGTEVLAIFSGPHAYISPTWYQAQQTVPTWNYVAVHAYGRLKLMDDDGEVEALLHRTIGVYEAAEERPWKLDESREFVSRMLRQIVAFRVPIERLEGKWKLNQNRPVEQRQRVIEVLSRREDENSRNIATLMRGAD
jgi:transcriptional regulator